MAKVIDNIIIEGLSGMIGKQIVIRSFRGKTYVSAAPCKPSVESEKQKQNRSKFRMATEWAKIQMKDPIKKEAYGEIAMKLGLPNAYTAAITDYMRNPVVEGVNITEEGISIEAGKKDFKVDKVEVVISDVNGGVIEKGEATHEGMNWFWSYRPQVKIIEGMKVEVEL